MSVRLSVCSSIHPTVCPSVHSSVCPFVHLSLSPSIRTSICFYVRPFVGLSVRHLSICPIVILKNYILYRFKLTYIFFLFQNYHDIQLLQYIVITFFSVNVGGRLADKYKQKAGKLYCWRQIVCIQFMLLLGNSIGKIWYILVWYRLNICILVLVSVWY